MLNNIPLRQWLQYKPENRGCPTIVTSISPSSGTVIFDIIDGMAICNIRLFTEDFLYLSLYKNTFINLIVLFANKGTFFIFYCIFVCHELNSNQMDYEDLNYFSYLFIFHCRWC